MRNFLIVFFLSLMLFLALVTPAIDINFWQKLLYKKEVSPEKKKKDFKICMIIWAIGTLILIIFAAIYAD